MSTEIYSVFGKNQSTRKIFSYIMATLDQTCHLQILLGPE